MVTAVLLHGHRPLEGPVPHSQGDPLPSSLLDHLAGLVAAVACNHLTVDLREGGGGKEGRREGGREGGREVSVCTQGNCKRQGSCPQKPRSISV